MLSVSDCLAQGPAEHHERVSKSAGDGTQAMYMHTYPCKSNCVGSEMLFYSITLQCFPEYLPQPCRTCAVS